MFFFQQTNTDILSGDRSDGDKKTYDENMEMIKHLKEDLQAKQDTYKGNPSLYNLFIQAISSCIGELEAKNNVLLGLKVRCFRSHSKKHLHCFICNIPLILLLQDSGMRLARADSEIFVSFDGDDSRTNWKVADVFVSQPNPMSPGNFVGRHAHAVGQKEIDEKGDQDDDAAAQVIH